MKITDVEAYVLRAPQPGREFWVSLKPVLSVNELVVLVRTDDGITGIGMGTARTPVREAGLLFQRGFKDLVVGEDPLRPELVWDRMSRTTFQRVAAERGWARGPIITACCAVDVALWDIVGRAARLPLYRILGGYADRVRTYAGGGYYRRGKDLAELRAEMARYMAMGHRAFKMKIGALRLVEDVARVAAVRETIGPDNALIVDVNGAWDLVQAREGVQALRDLDLTWIEEPIAWEDAKRTLPLLRADCRIPIAEGHGELTHFGCLEFIDNGAVDIIQFDATSFGGITQSRKVMALAELHHLRFSPHHDPQIHAHLVAASPAGFMTESHADPERDPVWFELFHGAPELRDGWLELSDRPGIGVELDEKAMAKYGERMA